MTINLTGSWRAVYSELDGEMTPVARFSGLVMTFKDKQFSIESNGQIEHQGTFSIDEKAKPAQITYVYTKSSFYEPNKPRVGIVQLAGDTLKNCVGAIGRPAPASFNTEPGSNAVMTVYQKHGSEAGTGVPLSRSRVVSQW